MLQQQVPGQHERPQWPVVVPVECSLGYPFHVISLKRVGEKPRESRGKRGKRTFNKYSIARSGLKKAALIARVMSSLAKPMLSI